MSIIAVLIPVGLVLLGVGVWAFFWAVRNEQFDDLETPALRVVLDPEDAPPELARDSQSPDSQDK